MASRWWWAGFFGRRQISALSLPRVGSGQRKEQPRSGLLPWLSLAEGSGVFAKHPVYRAVLEGLYPTLGCRSSVSSRADKSQDWSPCGESAYSPLILIPGRFPSSRKHKAPSSIIHQVLNFIKKPPDTRAGCSTLLPGWESAGSGCPKGRAGSASGFCGLGVGDPSFRGGRFNKDSGVSASPFHK